MQRDPIAAASFIAQYREACSQTDQLFALVKPEYLTARPVRERHRLLFYIGHLEAFDWNLLSARLFDKPPFDPAYDTLFAFGIDPVGGGLPTDTPADWPSMAQIYAYRDTVRAQIESAICDVDFADPTGASVTPVTQADDPDTLSRAAHSDAPTDADAATLLNVAIEHRQMHAETLAYLIHQMPLAQKRLPAGDERAIPVLIDGGAPVDGAALLSGEREGVPSGGIASGHTTMVRVEGGEVILGLARMDGRERAPSEAADDRVASTDAAEISGFGWDNEYIDHAHQRRWVDGFSMDRHMVSNGDFLAFVDAGGYRDPQHWQPEDWAWRHSSGVEHPAFWVRGEGGWLLQTMFALPELPLDWPVYVSHAEARAYAHFVGKRLPSEAEWMRAALGATQTDGPPVEGNFDFRHWDPVPVHAYPRNRSQFGVHGQFGNGWEWTGDKFAPFPGFRKFSFYPGYSADFFDDHHFVMKGGSPRTASRMLRPTFRNWFQPHYPYVYAGFRCASDQPK